MANNEVTRRAISRRETCRLCGGKELTMAMHLEPSALADEFVPVEKLDVEQQVYPLDLYLCNQCSHYQLLDVVDPEILFSDYIYVTSSSPGLVDYFKQYADEILHRVDPDRETLFIDIGSNDGTLLRFVQEHGLRVLGVDPAQEVARQATASGIETLATFFNEQVARDIKKEYGPATIITANNVYAHADNLADVTKGIRHLLAPDGVFVFEVSYMVDLLQNMVFDYIYHEHLCYHSVKPLSSFFRSLDMELIAVDRKPTKGGSIRGMVQLKGGPRKVAPSVNQLITLEDEMALGQIESAKAFADSINQSKHELWTMLDRLSAQGHKIAGYGASATVTTLIHHFELAPILEFVVDDNADRQGLFSPGHHLPVLSPQALYNKKIDDVIILAWRFAEPIIKNNKAFLDQGGHFIVPLPTLKVI